MQITFLISLLSCIACASTQATKKQVKITSGQWEIRATLTPIPEDSEGALGIENLEVLDAKTKKVVQELSPVGDEWREEYSHHGPLLDNPDVNKDGHRDLQVRTTCGNKSCGLDIFLFDPKTKKFIRKE